MKDLTDMFRKGCKLIPKGRLLQCQGFDLSEGVAAITIGDPRIDSGMVTAEIEQTDKKIQTMQECIGVFDRLIIGIYMHLNGEMIVPCIFSCMFLDYEQVPTFQHFKSLLLRALLVSRKIVIGSRLFLEEDFMPDIAGFTLYSKPVNFDLDLDFKAEASSPNFECLKSAIYSRLEFLTEFINLFNCNLMLELISKLQGLLRKLIETSNLGTEMISYFKVQRFRKLFPISVISDPEVSVKDGFDSWVRLLKNLAQIPRLIESSPTHLPKELYLSTSSLNIFERSVLYQSILNKYDDFNLKWNTASENANTDVNLQIAIEEVSGCYSQCLGTLVKLLCLNRGRQRRQLIRYSSKMYFMELESKRLEADLKLQFEVPFSVHSFIAKQRLVVILWIFEMGTELELYAVYEYPFIYRNIQEVLKQLCNVDRSVNDFTNGLVELSVKDTQNYCKLLSTVYHLFYKLSLLENYNADTQLLKFYNEEYAYFNRTLAMKQNRLEYSEYLLEKRAFLERDFASLSEEILGQIDEVLHLLNQSLFDKASIDSITNLKRVLELNRSSLGQHSQNCKFSVVHPGKGILHYD